ncbi:MAG: mono/diheme cytochrome c family protein [Akkermansiaceae bacterium]|jgi:mono/diheme cytochrome c family protein
MADSQSSKDLRPDLDETINVSEAHGAINDAASAVGREKAVRENGMESVSLWLILISGIVVLMAGAVMGQGGAFFGYGELTKAGYMRGNSPVKEEVILPPITALALLQKEGKKTYANCSSCHQSSGGGGNGFPPLAGSEWVTGNTERLAMIIHNGVGGPIQVAGKTYEGVMGNIGGNFTAKELAGVMTYIRTSWGNEASLVTPQMAEEALRISKERGGKPTTADELKKNHDKMLTGDILDPGTLLDPETWEPVPVAQ